MSIEIIGEAAMQQLGRKIADRLESGLVIYLEGDLGAGKTTLVRGIIQGLGYDGRVKSPTYTLIEPYLFDGRSVYHLDLYRLSDPEELEFLGLRDMLDEQSIALVEWPERGEGFLQSPDIEISIGHKPESRIISFISNTDLGERVLSTLN